MRYAINFMVDVRLKPGSKNRAVDTFEQRGPNRDPTVKFHAAWMGANTDIAFVLIESQAETDVASAAENWNALGEIKIHPVIDIEQY
jgi:hypothetical protein